LNSNHPATLLSMYAKNQRLLLNRQHWKKMNERGTVKELLPVFYLLKTFFSFILPAVDN
jgi:hypothetical protein